MLKQADTPLTSEPNSSTLIYRGLDVDGDCQNPRKPWYVLQEALAHSWVMLEADGKPPNWKKKGDSHAF